MVVVVVGPRLLTPWRQMLRKGGSLLTNVAPEGRQWLNRKCLCVSIWREVIMGRTVQVLH